MAASVYAEKPLEVGREVPEVFPLTLTPLEHYMLADDRPDYPMTPFLRLTFGGRLTSARLKEAVRTAQRRHPLLRALLRGDVHGRTAKLCWIEADGLEPSMSWAAEHASLDFPRERRIDLRSEVGVRLWVREGLGQTVVWLQWHHACCDLIGILQFVEEILEAYDSPDRPTHRRTLEPQRLSERGSWRLSRTRSWLRLPRDLWRIGSFFRATALPLTPAVSPPTKGDDHIHLPAFASHFFDEIELQHLVAVAKQCKSTVNDVLLRDLFLALGQWTAERGCGHRGTLRIGVPLNHRFAGDDSISAANVVSTVFLDRRQHQIADLKLLLTGIHKEMAFVKRCRMGVSMLRFLGWLGSFRGGMQLLFRRTDCLTTAVFSNVGSVLADAALPRINGRLCAGDVCLESIEVAQVTRPGTNAIFTATTYAGRLNICLGYDHRIFRPDEAKEILQVFIRQVYQTIKG